MDKLVIEPQQEGTLDLYPQQETVRYPEAYQETKANRMAVVLGQESPGIDVLMNSVQMGTDENWKQIAKNNEDLRNSNRRNELIREIAYNRDPSARPSMDDIMAVSGLSDDALYASNLDTAIEEQYARQFTNLISQNEENNLITDALAEDEEAAMEVLDRSEYAQVRTLIAQDIQQEMVAMAEEQSWGGFAVDVAKTMIPGYTNLKLRERIETPTGALLIGNNLEEQIATLYSLPPDQFKVNLKRITNELAEDNVPLARQFSDAVVQYSSSSRSLDNFLDVVDVASAVPTTAVGKLAKGMKTAGKAILRNPANIADVAADMGAIRTSAVADVATDASKGDVAGVTTITNLDQVDNRLTGVFSPSKANLESTRLDATANNRLRTTILRNADLINDFLNKGVLVDRLEPAQLAQASQEAFDRIKDTFTNAQHNIIDMTVEAAEMDRITNTATAVVKFGRKDGQLFSTETGAKNWADKFIGLKTNDYKVVPSGVGGYHIEVRRPVADLGKFREAPIETTLKTPESLSGTFMDLVRSPDYILPQQNVQARGRVVHGQEMLADKMRQLTAPFAGKNKVWQDEMSKVFKDSRTNRQYLNTTPDFENKFFTLNGKYPTADQTEAYFSYVMLNDLDYLIRDADIVKQKMAKNMRSISFTAKDSKGVDTLTQFEGKVVDKLPLGSKDRYRITTIDNGKTTTTSSRFLTEDKIKAIQALQEQGYKIILRPDEVTYYVMKNFKEDNLKLQTLNRVEGGHNEYRYKNFIKQGEFKGNTGDRVTTYVGDKSLFVAPTERQAREIAEQFEKARLLVKSNDPSAKKFIDDNLPLNYGEFIKKVKQGDIQLDTPIVAVRSGQRTSDILKYDTMFESFDDAVQNEHNILGDVGGRYTGEKADTILDVLTSENGIVARQDWEALLDPMETLKNSTANMLDVRLVNDYKVKSVNDWIQEFGNLLDAPNARVRTDPMHYLHNPVWSAGADPLQVRAAQNARNAILNLYNYRNPVETSFQVYKEKMLSSVYDFAGEEWRQFADDKLIYTAKDAQTFMRSAAFSMKLGFFNPKQLFLQASQAANIMSISPIAGVRGIQALPMMRMMLMSENDNVINGVWNKFGRISGWEKSDFMEMMQSYKDSGFSIIGKGTAYVDDFSPKTIQTGKVGKAWQYNTVFFEEGERIARGMAYSTSYREWRTANPGKAFDRFQQTKVLQRAKDLSLNMSRDSNAVWQKGWSSIMTQFMGYQARFMEQLWDGGLLKGGRKLTGQEKARLITMNSFMYGLPVGASAYTGLSIRDWVKDQAAAFGVEINDTMLEPWVDGFNSVLYEVLSGNDADVASSYGPNGFPNLSELLNGEKGIAEILGGASGGVMYDTIASMEPAIASIMSAMDPDSSNWKILVDDLMEPLKNITTVNNLDRIYEVMNTHRWLSRTGTHLTDATVNEAILAFLTGVNPDRVSEAYNRMSAIKGDKEHISSIQKEMQGYFVKMQDAARRGDIDSMEKYRSKGWALGIQEGLSLNEMRVPMKRALQDRPFDESIIESYRKRFELRNELKKTGEQD